MFKVGDRVRVKLSGKEGIVETIFDADYWHHMAGGAEDEFAIRFDDDGSLVNIRESLLEYVNVPKCECGARFTSFPQIHSYWCKFYTPI
jgi:hypothetical protein